MTWNYRVFRIPHPDEDTYYIGECYYDKDGKPHAFSMRDHNHAYGDTLGELRETLALMTTALDDPVIELSADGKHFADPHEMNNASVRRFQAQGRHDLDDVITELGIEPDTSGNSLSEQLWHEISRGRRIQAVKVYRHARGGTATSPPGLKEAVDVIDWMREHPGSYVEEAEAAVKNKRHGESVKP